MNFANHNKTWRSTLSALSLGAATAALATAWSNGASAVVVISTAATRNMSCSAGICTATRASAILNVTDLQTMLGAGDLKVTTGTGTLGGQVLDVLVTKPFSWSNSNRLTLEAFRSISITQPVSVMGTGSGLTFTTNAGGAGGALTFGTQGYVKFWDVSSSLSINSNPYTLVNDLDTLGSDIGTAPTGRYALASSRDASVDHGGSYATSPVQATFGGAFEGLGNTITNLTVTDSADTNVGLFANVSGGELRDVVLTHASITGSKTGGNVGALVGHNAATIAGVHSTSAKVIGGKNSTIGGLVGSSGGPISNSYAAGAVRARSGNIGGLVGTESVSSIDNSHAAGNVTASGASTTSNVGGLVGSTNNVSITNAWSSSALTANDSSDVVGGLVGFPTIGTISNSYASGNISASAALGVLVGGLVGDNNGAAIDSSYAKGSVSAASSRVVTNQAGTVWAGGLAGTNDGGSMISNSYALGNVSGTSATAGGNATAVVGGLIGEDDSNALSASYSIGALSGSTPAYTGGSIGISGSGAGNSDLYWDTTTSGTNTGVGTGSSSGITGLSDSDLTSGLPAGFTTPPWNWNQFINGGYPYL